MAFKNVSTYLIRSEKGRKETEQIFLSAVHTGNVQVVTNCIKNGVDPNIKTADGLTPLHIAAEKEDLDVGRALLNAKAIRVNTPASNGNTPLINATIFRNDKFVLLLLKVKAEDLVEQPSEVTLAPKKGAESKVGGVISKPQLQQRKFGKMWFLRGANPNCRNNMERTALHIAAALGEYGIVKALVEGGGDVNMADCFGNTPLTYAVLENPNAIIAKYLLKKGANPNLISCRPNSLFLELALNCNSEKMLEMVELLLNFGVDIGVVNPVTQMTALHLVGISGYVPLAELLISKGADIYARDSIGRNAFDSAVQHQQKDLVRMYRCHTKCQRRKAADRARKITFDDDTEIID